MQMKINVYHFVSLPNMLGIEQIILNDVIPLVNTGQMRGGRILSQAVLKHEDGRYLWLVNYETTGGNWHESNIEPAKAKLETMATIYATYELSLLNSEAREPIGDDRFDENYPIGHRGDTVRLYQVSPRSDRKLEWFEREMKAQVLPAVSLHPPNRFGHSTNAQMLLKVEGLVEGARYQWLLSYSIHEPFKDDDTFRNDIDSALSEFDALGSIRGFSDYRVVYFLAL